MRALLTAVLCTLALPLHALCSGADVRSRLDAADLARLDATVADTPFGTGIAWTARKAGRQITVIGTMHVFDPRIPPLAYALQPTIAAADLLLVEAGPEEEETMTRAMATDPSLMFLTDGPTLPDRLDEETWQALADAARARGVPVILAAKMQPWYLAMTLSMPPCAMPDVMAGKRGLDASLIEDATFAGVPVQALEPWDTLFTVMAADPVEDQIEQLRLSITEDALQAEMFGTMLDSYFAGQTAEIWELSRIMSENMPSITPAKGAALFQSIEDGLLTTRNAAWIPVIDTASDSHPNLVVAVGAAHLPGKNGVLNLLAQDGWTLAPLN